MRSALICVFFTLVVQREGSNTASGEHEEDFNPTPIPLSDWPRDIQESAGTLHEIINTEELPVTAAVPAHYWEDALRHSVYLTLVRDKIDQLIAEGDYISPDSKPENPVAKEFDDHDLWDKIKTARFDRLKEEPIPPADFTILARGRLLEDEQGYRFIEDNASQKNCSDSHCAKGLKALWSVKRMRQRETSPGKYHYELTFSVSSQTSKKVKRPYENPVRTFTIKETIPTFERPKVHPRKIYQDRPQRAIWFHRNINPIPSYQKLPAPNTRGLDRIFSSLFSDEESYEEPHRYKQKTYMPNVYLPHAKVAILDDREPSHQRKLVPYQPKIPKPQPHRFSHPPIAPPPVAYVQHPYLNVDYVGNLHPYAQKYLDNRFLPSNVIKTTRPAVLPTPITNYPLLKESTIEVPVKTRLNATEYTTKEPDVVTTYKIYHHQKQSPIKISYVPDHIRPPVYNAPPGIFVTMDKKPFKPMPPLKYSHMNKPQKATLPDFRPSPQVLDTRFFEQDSSADTAFRPITMNITEIYDYEDDNISTNKNVRKPVTAKKPAKKHENIKSTRLTTVIPEIITAESLTIQDVDDEEEMEWANILGAFTKTTPMASHKEQTTKENIEPITSTTPLSTTTNVSESLENYGDSYEEDIERLRSTNSTTTTTTTITPKPKKRTRPPPKFNKTEKIKKHKRVTTTTTLKPTRKYPLKKQTDDLTPQASSAATSATNSTWETKTYRVPAGTTTSSTTPRPTPTIKLTSTSTSGTTTTSSPTVDTEQPVVTTQPKSKNRFRQSTLMQKGTSVNHDKWSTSTLDKIRTNPATSQVYALRRKASKFTGYIPASTPRSPEVERDREDHRDHAYNFSKESISNSSTTEKVEKDILVNILPTQPTYEEQEMSEIPPSVHDDELEQEDKLETELEQRGTTIDVQESKDDHEYIFPTGSVIQEVKEYIGLDEQTATTELTVITSPYSTTKKKTKCKKKKHNNLTTEGTFKSSSKPETTDRNETLTLNTTSTTESPVTPEIFNELFEEFTMDDAAEEPAEEYPTPAPEQNRSESRNHESYLHLDDELEDFLYSLNEKRNAHDDKPDEEYDDELEDEDSPFNIHEDSKQFKDYYEDAQESEDRPFSLLKLMDME